MSANAVSKTGSVRCAFACWMRHVACMSSGSCEHAYSLGRERPRCCNITPLGLPIRATCRLSDGRAKRRTQNRCCETMRWTSPHSSKAFLLNANSDCSRCTQVRPALDPSVARSRVSSSLYVGFVACRAQTSGQLSCMNCVHASKHLCMAQDHVCPRLEERTVRPPFAAK